MPKRRSERTPIVLLALVWMGCAGVGGPSAGASTPPARDASDQEIRAFLRSYYDALSDRDWERWTDHFWPAATLTTVWTPPGEEAPRVVAMTAADFVAAAAEGPDSREIFEERMTSLRLRVAGGLAQAWATYDARFGDPGDIMEWSGTDAFTLLYHAGEWRIAALAYAADEP